MNSNKILKENMEIFVLPEFGRIQFEGFNRFITKGLIDELTNIKENNF